MVLLLWHVFVVAACWSTARGRPKSGCSVLVQRWDFANRLCRKELVRVLDALASGRCPRMRSVLAMTFA